MIGSWIFLALLAWFDPFGIGRHRYEQSVREPEITLVTPKPGIALPKSVWLSGDGYGARFAMGNIADAPVRYGTEDQLMRSSFATGGPQSLTEAMALPEQAIITDVAPAVRVVPLISGGYDQWQGGDEQLRVFDLPEPADTELRGPKEGRIVLARGCLRLGNGAGQLVVLGPRANSVFVDDEGWLTVGGLSGMQSLRVGEPGMIGVNPLPNSPALQPALAALRIQCGGYEGIVVIDTIARTPVCDLTEEQAAQNRAALSVQQRELTDRMTQMRESQVSACMAQGKTRLSCQRSIPPMPPPPGMSPDQGQILHRGRAPGDMCIPQGQVPVGKWSRDQPS
ncbi:hypothetical protein EKN06_07030 [Croceicoccus ponticola]|uniref:Uncharacterized protein n=1 Tax=Croceicoccus ponticola TaxID=2217664 RepID=A0A437GYC2_9SPHN|nr:hypothetical protein EKN06_07030 [Croceicoccus ponticola]